MDRQRLPAPPAHLALPRHLAKSVYQFPTTTALMAALKAQPHLRRLCGLDSANDVHIEPTFSSAFAVFAQEE